MTDTYEQIDQDFSFDFDKGLDDELDNFHRHVDDGNFESGVKTGIESLKGMYHGGAALVGDLVGDQDMVDENLQRYEDDMAEAQFFQSNADVTDISEIESLSDIGSFISFHTGSGVTSIAATIASGGVGGAIGSSIAKQGTKALLEKEVAKKVAQGMTEKAAAKRVAAEMAEQSTKSISKGAGIGASVAAYGTSTGMNAGLNMGNIYEETGEVRSDVALGAGAISGALDALPVIGVLRKMGVGKVAQQEIERGALKVLKDTGAGAVSTGLQEGTTEALQTIVEQSAVQFVDDNQEMFSDYDWHEIQNAFFAGMAGGAPMGGIGGVASNTFANKANSENTNTETIDSANQELNSDTLPSPLDAPEELGALQTGSEPSGAGQLSFRQLSSAAKQAKITEVQGEVDSINAGLTQALTEYETAHSTQGDTETAMAKVKDFRKQLRQARSKLEMAQKGRVPIIDIIKQVRANKPGAYQTFSNMETSVSDPVLGDLSSLELTGQDPIEALNTGTDYKKPEIKQPDFEKGGIGLNAIPSWAERNAIEGELMPPEGLPAPAPQAGIGFSPLPGIEARSDIQVPPVDDAQRRMNTGFESQHPEPGFNPVQPEERQELPDVPRTTSDIEGVAHTSETSTDQPLPKTLEEADFESNVQVQDGSEMLWPEAQSQTQSGHNPTGFSANSDNEMTTDRIERLPESNNPNTTPDQNKSNELRTESNSSAKRRTVSEVTSIKKASFSRDDEYDPETYITDEDHHLDLGFITPEISKVIKKQAAPIRLQYGEHVEAKGKRARGFGYIHIEKGHGHELVKEGFSNPLDAVRDVLENFTEIRRADKGRLQLVRRNETKKDYISFIELKPESNGDFYSVVTWFPNRKVQGELLWTGSPPQSQGGHNPTGFSSASDNKMTTERIGRLPESNQSPEGDKPNTTTDQNKSNKSRTVSSRSVRGMTKEQLERVIMPELQAYIHAPQVNIVGKQSELPSWIVNQNADETNGTGRINAVYDPNTQAVYIVAENINSKVEAKRKLEHELRGHFGMEALLGNDFGKLLRQVELLHKSGNPYVVKVIPTVEKNYPDTDRINFYSEVIAHLAEEFGTSSKMGRALKDLWVRIKAAVRRWRRETLGIKTPFSETELKNLLIQAGRLLQTGLDTAASGRSNSRKAQFSRGTTVNEESAASFSVGAYTWKDDWIRRLQDKLQPLKKVQVGIGNVSGESDAYRKETLMHGKLEKKLEDFEKEYIDPITTLMSEAKIPLYELDMYLYARHARERNEYIAGINPDMPDGGSGMTNAQADEVLARASATDHYNQLKQLGRKVDRMAKMRIRLLRDNGLEQPEVLEAWGKYDHYVPLKGWEHGEEGKAIEPIVKRGQGFDIRGKESVRALGRRTLAASPLTNLIGDVENAIQRVEKNKVGQSFLKLVRENPNKDYWEIFTAEDLGVTRAIKQVRGEDGVLHDKVVYETDKSPLFDRRNFLSVKENGKELFIKLEDERLMTAMKNLGTDNLNPLVKAMGQATRFLASMVTSYNPEFVISNMARDIQTAVHNLVAEADIDGGRLDGNKIATKVVKDLPKSIRGIWRALREKSADGNEYQKLWEQFKEDGGKIGFYSLQDFESQQKRIHSKINRAGKGWKTWMLNKGEGLLDYINHGNAAIENGVRLAAYKHAIDAGVEREQAAELAKNLTVNFNRRGEWGTFVNTFYMFFNAAIQGTAQLARVMQSKKAQKVMTGMVVFGGALAVFNSLMAGDDEDGENLYAKLPDYIKERNLVLINPFADGKENRFITIPLPYGYNVFHVLGTAIGELITGDRSAVEAATMVSLTALGAFNPIGTGQSEEFDKALIKTFTPTLASPIAELAMNENFFGGTIYRENFPTGTPRPDSHLAKANTGGPYKELAKALNAWTGGSEFRSGVIDVHPESFSHFVNFAFGGLGNLVNRSLDLSYKLYEDEDVEARDIPFLRKVVSQPGSFQDLQSFYDRNDEINQFYKEYRSLRGAERTRFARENQGLISLYYPAKSLRKKLKRIREELERVEVSSMSDALKSTRRKRLEREQEKLINAFNRRYLTTK